MHAQTQNRGTHRPSHCARLNRFISPPVLYSAIKQQLRFKRSGATSFLEEIYRVCTLESMADLSFCSDGINAAVWSTKFMRKVQGLLESEVFDLAQLWGDMLVIPSQRTLDELLAQGITEVGAYLPV